MTHEQWTIEEKLAVLSRKSFPSSLRYVRHSDPFSFSIFLEITVEDMRKHIVGLLAKVHMRILVNGNLYKDVRRFWSSLDGVRVAELVWFGLVL